MVDVFCFEKVDIYIGYVLVEVIGKMCGFGVYGIFCRVLVLKMRDNVNLGIGFILVYFIVCNIVVGMVWVFKWIVFVGFDVY